MAVKDLIAKLDAAKLQEQAARAEREQSALEQARREAEASAARKLLEKEEEERRRREAAEQERQRWRVDEEAAARDVQERKKQFLEANRKQEVKRKPKLKDIPTIVIDLGSGMVKAGYAGEDAPRWIFNSVIGSIRDVSKMDLEKHAHIKRDTYVGDAVWAFQDVLAIRRVIKRGVVQSWEDCERMLAYLFFEEMKIDAEDLVDYPVLLTEEPFSPRKNREKLGEILFEKFRVPAVFIGNTSTLAMYSTGQLTGVVVDIGYNVSSSVAVFDGDVVPRTMHRLDVGGADLDTCLCKLLQERGYDLRESRPFDSFLIRDIKERHCYVAEDIEAEKKRPAKDCEVSYDVTGSGNDMLPGYEGRLVPDAVTLGPERFQCAEALFDASICLGHDMLITGVQKMVQESIRACPIDLTKTMYANIILAGGTTMLPGFAERLRKELRAHTPPSVVVNVIDKPTRSLAAWIGGSILASTRNFNPHWVSRDEYLRYGPDLLHGPL